MYKNKMNRFYNGETKQIHRFIPLFQNIDDGKVMGMCMDSDKINWRSNNNTHMSNYNGFSPIIRKGQMVLVDSTNDTRVGMSYKGENLFNLIRVYDDENGGGFHTFQHYLKELWFNRCGSQGWKDYEEGV